MVIMKGSSSDVMCSLCGEKGLSEFSSLLLLENSFLGTRLKLRGHNAAARCVPPYPPLEPDRPGAPYTPFTHAFSGTLVLVTRQKGFGPRMEAWVTCVHSDQTFGRKKRQHH